MKRLLIIFTFLHVFIVAIVAQNADYKKAVAHYKNIKNVTAVATKTSHKNAVTKDVVTKGTLVMNAPSEVSITMDGGKDQLLMQGNVFTMTVKGKKHTTNSQKNTQFATFQTVFESIMSGGTIDISKLSDLTISKQGNNLVLTITPKTSSKKEARRMMFSSFVFTLDSKSGELRTLRMNERAGYTEYSFSSHRLK